MVFTGTYEMVSSDNYEKYLEAIGVGLATRKIAASGKPTVEIRQDGGHFTLKTSTALKKTELNFALGVEFVEETDDGRKANTVFTAEGENQLIQVQKVGQVTATTIRAFNDGGFDVTHEAAGVVAKRSFKRL